MISLNCENCGHSFSVKNSRANKAKFCSWSCKSEYQKLAFAGRPMPDGCRKESRMPFTRCAPASACGHITKKGRSYCPNCREKRYSKRRKKLCVECSSQMTLSPSEYKKYKCCSYECRNKQISKRQKGRLSHLWRGGVTNEDRIMRNSAAYDNWRKSVFSRDNYTCQFCGERGGRLTADHIKEWFLYPALRFDVSNGRTLCEPCHRKTETFGGKAYAKMLRLSKNRTLQYRLL